LTALPEFPGGVGCLAGNEVAGYNLQTIFSFGGVLMRKFLVFVFLMSFASLAFAGLQDKVTMDFRDTDLREICKILAK